MSLEDKLISSAEKILTCVESLDTYILSFHETIANYYQDKTGTSKRRLVYYAYSASTGSILVSSVHKPLLAIASAYPGLNAFIYSFCDKYPKVIDEQEELNRRRYLEKGIGVFLAPMYLTSATCLLMSLSDLVRGIGDYDGEEISKAMQATILFSGFLLQFSGEYLSRVKVDPPKGKPKKATEKPRRDWKNLLPYPRPRPAVG